MEEPTKWSQKFGHWMFTTTVAVIGLAVAITGFSLSYWDRLFGDHGPTISMKHEDFAKLSYGEQLDVCIPYLESSVQAAFEAWKQDIRDSFHGIGAEPVGNLAGIADSDADGQSVINLFSTVIEIAHKSKDVNTGLNLVGCVSPSGTGISQDKLVAAGNNLPYSPAFVVSQSIPYTDGAFAGVSAGGRMSRVVCVDFGGPDWKAEYQVTIVSGHSNPDKKMWAVTRAIFQGDPGWIDNLPDWHQ